MTMTMTAALTATMAMTAATTDSAALAAALTPLMGAGLATATGVLAWLGQPWLRGRAGLLPRSQRSWVPVVVSALLAALGCLVVRELRPALAAGLFLALVGPHLFTVDLQQKRLPTALIRPVMVSKVAVFALDAVLVERSAQHLVQALVCTVVASLAFHGLRGLSNGGMGRGDVRLAGLLGLYLGWAAPEIAATGLLAGFLLAAAALTPFLLSGRIGRRAKVPFGPFMLLGAVLVLGLCAVGRAGARAGASLDPTIALGSALSGLPLPSVGVVVGVLLAAGWSMREVSRRGGAPGPVRYPQPLTAARGPVVTQVERSWRPPA